MTLINKVKPFDRERSYLRINTLFLLDSRGQLRKVNAAKYGCFTDIYCSDADVLSLLQSVTSVSRRPNFSGEPRYGFNEPHEMFVLANQFDPEKDWAFATELRYYGETIVSQILFGSEKFGTVDDIIQFERAAQNDPQRVQAEKHVRLSMLDRALYRFKISSSHNTTTSTHPLPSIVQRFILTNQPEPILPALKEFCTEL